MGDAGRAPVKQNFAHLIKKRSGWSPDGRREQWDRETDQGSVALVAAGDSRHVRAIEYVEGNDMGGVDFGWIGAKLRDVGSPNDDGCYDEAGARSEIVEEANDVGLIEHETDLLFDLADRRFLGALAFVGTTARKRPLAGVPS